MTGSRGTWRKPGLLHRRQTARVLLLGATAALAVSCGSGPSAPSPSDPVIVIGPAGVAPVELRIKAWSRVTFVNNDSRPHTIVSDPVDVHSQCPPLNLVGLLNPGESRNTGTLNLPGTCDFHDHGNKTDATLPGRIVVDSAVVTLAAAVHLLARVELVVDDDLVDQILVDAMGVRSSACTSFSPLLIVDVPSTFSLFASCTAADAAPRASGLSGL